MRRLYDDLWRSVVSRPFRMASDPILDRILDQITSIVWDRSLRDRVWPTRQELKDQVAREANRETA